MECPAPHATYKCISCPRAKREVRASLAMFALANFSVGMAMFMFLFCSSSSTHVEHLKLLFTNPTELFQPHTHK